MSRMTPCSPILIGPTYGSCVYACGCGSTVYRMRTVSMGLAPTRSHTCSTFSPDTVIAISLRQLFNHGRFRNRAYLDKMVDVVHPLLPTVLSFAPTTYGWVWISLLSFSRTNGNPGNVTLKTDTDRDDYMDESQVTCCKRIVSRW